MGESRQQRRAGERAEAKAARRAQPPQVPIPAPPQAPTSAIAPTKRPQVLEVELSRFYFPDDEEEARQIDALAKRLPNS
jgi:hypothetical protein